MNKFSRLFEERQIAAKAKAKAQAQAVTEAESLATAIAATTQVASDAQAEKLEADSPTQISEQQKPKVAKTKTKSTKAFKLKPTAKSKAKAKQKPKSGTPRKRGRPANGKRSDPNWYGRTFYIRKQTDEQLEDALRKLRRSGIEIDKSQLVDALLNAWANVELEQIEDFRIGEILESPEDSENTDK
ncbi:hypothetical protein IQ266_08450 [filamentous cyanobacterium LEGE 11480]|uniref:Uncharacterized protein n=1 Tax=Romeriopsis navalis LEGE 11480 TaxID=2777977 RepID=A0A928VNI2_9CYAN|nr:hypothetical protein [Romeriopsis navalis]MBE9029755.1 hypothetical protein [Romeriopsis navalis LEGE 11480]